MAVKETAVICLERDNLEYHGRIADLQTEATREKPSTEELLAIEERIIDLKKRIFFKENVVNSQGLLVEERRATVKSLRAKIEKQRAEIQAMQEVREDESLVIKESVTSLF